MSDGVSRALPKSERVVFALRNLVQCLAHDARENAKEALADELEAIEESLQKPVQRNIQTDGSRRKL